MNSGKAVAKQWVSPYNPLDPNAPNLPSRGELRAIVPPDCFEKSYIKGLSWILFDFGLAALLAFSANILLSVSPPHPIVSPEGLSWLAGWSLYAFCMGSTMAGCWVLAHECGHGILFPSHRWNDAFGFVIHQVLLCPYYSWRYSHSKHHQFTSHMHRETNYVPEALFEASKSSILCFALQVLGNGSVSTLKMALYYLVGWPLYLSGTSLIVSRTNHDGSCNTGERLDHFNPNSKLLPPKQKTKTLISTATFFATLGFLIKMSADHGTMAVFLWYGFPVLLLYFWFVTYTFLHHIDPSVPVYGEDEWTWMRGALTTIDRDYGIFNFFHHNIGSTHVVHHLFHEIPFYNAKRATKFVREALEPKGLYNFDPTPWWKALWQTFRKCQYVSDTVGIQYRKSFDNVDPVSLRKMAKMAGKGF